uniref:Uncharacterized protein n=1 Tax=Anguilla anguilla TaxID=7936 RepID=A0A0E9TUG8_ANGAN
MYGLWQSHHDFKEAREKGLFD